MTNRRITIYQNTLRESIETALRDSGWKPTTLADDGGDMEVVDHIMKVIEEKEENLPTLGKRKRRHEFVHAMELIDLLIHQSDASELEDMGGYLTRKVSNILSRLVRIAYNKEKGRT